MEMACVPSPVTASLMQPGSPLAVHMLQDVGPDVSPLAQTQPVETLHRMEDPHSQGGDGGEGLYWAILTSGGRKGSYFLG